MKGSNNSGGGATSPYPSPLLQAINHSDDHHASASGIESGGVPPAMAEPGTSNYYASGNSPITLSNAASPLSPEVNHTDYMYAMNAHHNMQMLSNSTSLSSAALEDSQKHSYHPIDFMVMAAEASAGNLAESLESGRMQRYSGELSPLGGAGMAMATGQHSTEQSSFVATSEQVQLSPLLPHSTTYGFGSPEGPQNKLYAPPSSPASGLEASYGPTPSSMPAAASTYAKALPDFPQRNHSIVFSDMSKQLQPQLSPNNSMVSTTTNTVDKSPLDPSMTARDITPSRLLAPSQDVSRSPFLHSPDSSVDTHRSTITTPFSELQRGAGGRGSTFPTNRLPNPPERPPSHLPLDAAFLADSQRSTTDVAGVKSSKQSTPIATLLSNPPSSAKAIPYQTPLALLAPRSSSSGSTLAVPSASVDAAPSDSQHNADKERPSSASGGSGSQRSAEAVGAVVHPPQPPPIPPSSQPSALTILPPSVPAAHAQRPRKGSLSASGSSSSSSPLSSAASQHSQKQPLPSPSEPAQPFPTPTTSAAETDLLTHFTPLIQQADYLKSDVKGIACTSAFTMGDMASTTVKLRLLRHEVLGRAEPIPAIQQSAISAGREKRLKTMPKREGRSEGATKAEKGASGEPSPPSRVVDVGDFHDTLVVFDNVLLSISFALWGSVAYYNELVRGLLRYCAADVAAQHKDAVGEERGTVPKSAADSKSRLKVPFSSVLRFLNHCGVDVLVMSSNRRAASSFCAKRQQVRRRLCRASAAACAALNRELTAGTEDPENQGDGSLAQLSPQPPPQDQTPNSRNTSEPLRRVLIALSYDSRQQLWCPLTVSRPVRQIAAAWHEHRRLTHRQARRKERRERRCEEMKAEAEKKKAAVEAKLNAWHQRMHALCQVENAPAAPAATEAASAQGISGEEPALQHVPVVMRSTDATTDGSNSPMVKVDSKLPFDGVLYPNLMQMDVSFGVILKQSMHPLFGIPRLRLIVGVPLGVSSCALGLALIIYVAKTTTVCFFDSITELCAVVDKDLTGSSGSDSSQGVSCYSIIANSALSGFQSKLSDQFLYGHLVSPGNCLIVTICCLFAATVNSALIPFFAVRYLALGGVQPLFHYVLQAAQVLLGAITCAFAAYVLFCFHGRRHTIACGAMKAADAMLCYSRVQSCGSQYSYAAYTRLRGPNVALILSIVYLVLCVLHWLVSFLPVVPSASRQDAIPTATPDTYTFRPSLFAPDGPTPKEVQQLRHVIQAPLRQDVRQCVQQQDRLLTASTTIGEMMQANRAQSLKQMKLNEQRRLRRAQPFGKKLTKNRDGSNGRSIDKWGRGGRSGGRQQRYLVWGDETNDNPNSSSDSDSTRSDAAVTAAPPRDRKVVLAPRLVERVNEIGAKVRARALQPPQTLHSSRPARAASDSEALNSMAKRPPGLNPLALSSPAPTSAAGCVGSSVSPFYRKSSSPRKVVVIAENSVGSDDAPESSVAAASHMARSPSLAAESRLSIHAATRALSSPRKATQTDSILSVQQPMSRSQPLARATTPMLTSESSCRHSSVSAAHRKMSLDAFRLSQSARSTSSARPSVVSSAVESEIDRIASRLRSAHPS
ncbi:hypothetical protein ABL78_0193 [Leptomonas seymouri]|uniref:Transmembrane protein n=1 Tax=Leptomonas seymouri TaxID=5684 RepID=A0A0N0P9I3_LEPSE|nr:hypothetical protein ABL78_0193 [Leptomonas seymouri]|eukprot:KPI90757.1 hypothetical protein ABL78_0193 [Leptomonas seymouri]